MKDIKLLYETSVKKQVEEPSIEKKEENGQTIEIKRTVKKAKPIRLGILKPDRKLFKAAEMFYAKSLSEYLKQGLMPFSLVAKRYANDGGVLTDKERERIKYLKDEAKKLEAVIYLDVAQDDAEGQKKKNDALIALNDINIEVNNISSAYSDIYDTTAEVKARNDTMEWWVLFLSYINADDKEFVPFFAGDSYEAKVAALEALEGAEEKFNLEVIKKLSFLISFWVTARNNVEVLDFQAMDKMYQDTMTTYKVEEGNDLKVAEVPATEVKS